MTILFFTRLFYPHIGGVEKHVLEISKRLVRKGYKVTVITEIPQKTYSKSNHSSIMSDKSVGKTNGIGIYRIDTGKENWFKKFRIWLWLWKHREVIQRADIVHCHDVFFWYLPFRFLYLGKPVYTTFHGYEGNNLPTKKAILMHKLAEKLSKGNICVGDFLKKWYGTKPNYVTYGGITISNLKFLSRRQAGQISNKGKKIEFLFLGRLEEETGIMIYLEALKILKDKGYRLYLDVLGDGSLRKKAQKFTASHNINARFYGFIEDVSNFLEKTDYIFTSRYLGILEALSYKKLIFAVYNNDIKKDYLKMTPFSGFIIIENNSQHLADKVEYYLSHKTQTGEKVNKGFDWVKRETWDKLMSTYMKLWKISIN